MLLKTGELADRIGLDRKTILLMVKAGEIPAALITPGGHYRYDYDQVIEAMRINAEKKRAS